MRRKSYATMACPVARSLEVVGDWWTLLLIRDALLGARRFDDFRAMGISDGSLSTRLEYLVEQGIFTRRPYQEHPPRAEYVLTEKGSSLLPVIVSLRQWGLAWTGAAEKPLRVLHMVCGNEVEARFTCPTCATTTSPAELALR